ncbi:hypothetical protein D3C71_2093700 [compost metagenome]
MVLAHRMGELQAQHFGIELNGLGGVLAAKGRMVEFLTQHRRSPVEWRELRGNATAA